MAPIVGSLLLSMSLTLFGLPPSHGVASSQEGFPSHPGVSAVAAAADPAPGADCLGRASRTIAALEYHASRDLRGLQAPNRAQNLRTWFGSDGITVVPRTGDAGWSWSWSLRSWGRSAPVGLPAMDPVAEGSRVEYAREGLIEWYENKPEGLEQGFSLLTSPPGDPADPLCIVGAIGGSLCASVREEGKGVDLVSPEGSLVLRYGDLVARDAAGRLLPSHLELTEDLLTLSIDDAGAFYPIEIDPVVTTPNWAYESNQAYANLGWSMATAGDVNGDGYSDLIVGAPYYDNGQSGEGRVFVFDGSADGLESSPEWIAEGNQAGADYGASVASAGDVDGDGYDDVIVGAPLYDHGETDEGRAFLYRGSPTGLLTGIAWSDEGDQASVWFGISVACAGDVNGDGYADIIVGADHVANGETAEGRVYVYYGSPDGPSDTPSWSVESNNSGAWFGRSVASAGDVNGDGFDDIIVGAPHYFDGLFADGAAFVYLGSAGGIVDGAAWSTTGLLSWEESYGRIVAPAGDVNGDGYGDVLVSAPDFASAPPAPSRGRAVLYLGSSSGLVAGPAWEVHGEASGDTYGWSVASAGDANGDGYADVIAGAPNSNGGTSAGKAYLYLGNWSGLGTTPAWTVEGDNAGDRMGFCVASSGDVNGDGFSDLAVGADQYSGGQAQEGRVSVYHGSSDGPQMSAGWVTESNQADAQFGASVAPAGDVNGDGYGDVLVGAPAYDNGQENEGAAFLFMGGQSGLAALPAWYAESNQANGWLGISVAGAGDVNGDGFEDVLVGAYGYDQSFTDEGAAFLWYGRSGSGPMGSPANADWSATSGQAFSSYGYCVAKAGDVNGDGYGDVIIGASNYDNGQNNEGAAFVYHGSAIGLSPTANWFHDCDHDGAFYGQSVASAGDFNGDGYSDVIVGAPLYDHPTRGEGTASLYLGSLNGVRTGAPFWYAESNQDNAMMGLSVASAGDVNGDGFSDVIIGAPAYDSAYTDGGRAFVWLGAATAPPSGTPDNADYWMGRPVTGANFGFSVASAGDVNGDGYSDVIVGAPFDDEDLGNVGLAYLWFGGPSSLPGSGWYGQGTQVNQDYGYRVASAGDVNGDGFSDIIVGSPIYDGGQNDEGRAYVYYGDQKRGLSRVPQQMQPDLTRPIAPLGLSIDRSRFALRARGRTPAGRGSVRLVWEAKPFRTPFDGSGIARGGWTDTGVPTSPGGSGVALSAVVADPPTGVLYRWRVRFETRNPIFPRSPWFYLSQNGAGEADFRGDPANSDVTEGAGSGSRVAASCSPNPFGPNTVISFTLEREEIVRIAIYDAGGRRVRLLADELMPSGPRQVVWDGLGSNGRLAGSGAYWVRVEAGGQRETVKVVRVE